LRRYAAQGDELLLVAVVEALDELSASALRHPERRRGRVSIAAPSPSDVPALAAIGTMRTVLSADSSCVSETV
jgi:hypothetical protein